MRTARIKLKRCETPIFWDEFVKNSPQGSIFCRTAFLEALDVHYDLWFAEENGRLLAGAIVLLEDKQPLQAPYPYTMYQGILFSGHSLGIPLHRRAKWGLDVTDSLIAGLAEQYDLLSFCLHYNHNDLRAIQWFNYHEAHLGQFKITLQYTGLINLQAFNNFDEYLLTIRQTRRNVYRQCITNGLTVEISQDIDLLNRLHQLTFERQSVSLDDKLNSLVWSIATAAIHHDFGELLICRNKNGEAASATLFIYDDKCGYYLFGANDPAHHKTNSGTYLLLENIRRCQARGLKWVDVVGINSPQRGDFKTSFNAVPVPYFIVNWQRPSNLGEQK